MENASLTEKSINEMNTATRRRALLPWWIKFFCWFFMVFGILSIVCLILGFTDIKPNLSLYGFETNEPFSPIGLSIISIGLFKGITGFSLWFEKNQGILLGKIDAIVGIVISIISMLVLPFFKDGYEINIRLEIVFLILFLHKLNKISNEW